MKKPDGFFHLRLTFVVADATLAQERRSGVSGSQRKRACAKGLFAGKTGLVGFWRLGPVFI